MKVFAVASGDGSNDMWGLAIKTTVHQTAITPTAA
jgi:hypothetical protein